MEGEALHTILLALDGDQFIAPNLFFQLTATFKKNALVFNILIPEVEKNWSLGNNQYIYIYILFSPLLSSVCQACLKNK